MADWQPTTPADVDGSTLPQRRAPDLVALIPGVLFIVLAVTILSGVRFPFGIFRDGGVLWIVLIGAGVWLLINELFKARRRR